MNRRRLTRACFGILFLGVTALIVSLRLTHGRPAPPITVEPPSQAASADDADHFTIDIANLLPQIGDKPQKEVDDQLRDWAVYGTLVHRGVDQDTFAKATLTTAPVRLPYLEDSFRFDYGRGRRAIVGEKDVILFYEASDRDPEATLGRLADRVRMEIGEIPAEFQIYECAPDLAAGEIRVTRKPSVAGPTMFGAAYGYVERTVSSLDDFNGWIGAIDDVTFAEVKGATLRLGGRRFPGSRTTNVTVEDVAALLQAHEELAQQRAWSEAKVATVQAAAEEEYKREAQRPGPYGYRGDTEQKLLAETIRAKYRSAFDQIKQAPEAPGFSLDPQWRLDGLTETLDQLATRPCGLVGVTFPIAKQAEDFEFEEDATPLRTWDALSVLNNAAEIPEAQVGGVCDEIGRAYGPRFRAMADAVKQAAATTDPHDRARAVNRAMLPIWQLKRELTTDKNDTKKTRRLALSLIDFVRSQHQVQCARYDGPLAGTAVGMNLFYTDLLAKLWQGVDSHHAAPAAFVPGFLSSPRMRLEPTWEAEQARLPSTRLWFGPKLESSARSESGDAMWFDHIATRVFAAGSNPAEPDKEDQPPEGSRRALGWWDRHFADVADYEQQYHVQNQIMKWSMITGWKRKSLSFLAAVPVDKHNRFDTWYAREKSNLRYQHPLELRPEAEWVTGTECVDLVASYPFPEFGSLGQISGGVSLAGERSLGTMPKVTMNAPRSLRQVGIDVSKAPGTAARARPLYQSKGQVAANAAADARMRSAGVDIRPSKIKIAHARGADGAVTVDLTAERGQIGTLTGRRPTWNRVEIAFREGKLEAAGNLAGRAANEPRSAAASSSLRAGRRGSVHIDGEQGPLVMGSKGDGAMKVTVGEPGTREGALARAAGEHVENGSLPGKAAEAGVDVLDSGKVAELLDQHPWQRITVEGNGALDVPQAIQRSFGRQGPPAGAREVTLRGVGGPDGLKVYVDKDGSIFVPRPEQAAARDAWRHLDAEAQFTAKDVRSFAEKAQNGAKVIERRELSDPRLEQAFDSLQDGRYESTLDSLRKTSGGDPGKLRDSMRALESKAIDNADYQLAHRNAAEAGRYYRLAGEVLGDTSPRVQMQRALAEIKSGQAGRGLARLGDPTKLPPDAVAEVSAKIAGDPAFEGLRDVFTAQRNPARPILGEWAPNLYAEVDGMRIQSALKLDRPLGGESLNIAGRKGILNESEPITVYLDDRFSLNRHDFEASASGTLAELAVSPHVSWRRVSLAGESLQPGRILDPATGVSYRRMTPAGVEAPGVATRIPAKAVFIRNCDANRDGTVTGIEQAACN